MNDTRKFHLIDNRIVRGQSTWLGEQPEVICTLHAKQNKPEHKRRVRAMLELLNKLLASERTPKPAVEPAPLADPFLSLDT